MAWQASCGSYRILTRTQRLVASTINRKLQTSDLMRDLSWKTLSSEYLYKDTWFTIRKDTCQRQDGQIVSPYYVYEFPTWVTALALTEDGKVILERQYRH